ncbi:DUF6396 domain-containing protein [Aquitalea denitrificans]|uniref:SEL1-like repeat protein n=1 Tax=Aquitalea denitrificans TaxID=519081 RepID=UPI00135890B5|nr:DUF6396 domain-containing protein [Aquitalea denitrificans]
MKRPISLPGLAGLWLVLALGACNAADATPKATTMPALPTVQDQLAFTCAYEKDRLPALDPEADQLYRHTRWLKRQQLQQEDPLRYPQMERLLRIATAYDHYQANLELRGMLRAGQAVSEHPVQEVVTLTERLIQQGIPGGYYDMAQLLQQGYGVKADSLLALQYQRKAADLGNPEAQYAIGEKLMNLTIDHPVEFEIGKSMKKCAAEQGHGRAGLEYGVQMQGEGQYAAAVKYFTLATKAGDPSGATWLADGFADGHPKNLAVPKDAERTQRYEKISYLLGVYSYLHPKVPELDSIVPLPPAPLPPWDGKIQWLKDFEANVPPPLPPEQRIRELAVAKALDPATGRPDPKAQAAQKAQAASLAVPPPSPDALPIGTLCHSGETCPQTGHWQVLFPADSIQGQYADLHANQVVRIFLQGNILPPHTTHYPRLLQRWRGYEQRIEPVQWQLVGYL